MKKNILICLFLSFFVFSCSVKADRSYVAVNDSINVRTGPATSYEKIALIKNGSSYDLLNTNIIADELKNGSCDSGWYNISYDGKSAYICSEYATIYTEKDTVATVDPNGDCEKTLSNAGFPSSYWSGLCTLKKSHPTWEFRAIKTNLDFKTVVEKESACKKSYVASSNSEYVDSSCKGEYTKTWYPASQKAVAHYMDPRNWLTEKHIFQFEFLQYEKNMSSEYANTVTNIIKNAQFYKYHLGIGNNLGNIINSAGSSTNVSPVFLASRMYQELGASDSLKNLYQGNYTGDNGQYNGYYNFFNYGVTDACVKANGTTYCGLTYAKNQKWNSPLSAITGAAKSLSSSYIAVGQYTTYLQKYNVVPTDSSKLYIHQYMTNIAAPSSESVITYNSYSKQNLLNNAFVFYIPVYNNMDNVINNSNNGASDIEDSNNPSNYDISSIVTLAGYKYSDDYITKIEPKTTVSEVKANIEGISGTNVVITDSKGNSPNLEKNPYIGTGYIVKISNATTEKSLIISIKGDTSGDGVVNALDLLQVQKNILGTYNLNGAYKLAADTSGDKVVNALDLLQIQKNILGTYKIVQ